MSIKHNRQALTLIVKTMLYIMLGFFIYVFISGLLGKPEYVEQDSYDTHIDIEGLAEGEYRVVEYRTQMILVLHRSPAMLVQLQQDNPGLVDPQSRHSKQPQHSENIYRSQYPQYLVVHAYDPDSGCQLVINTAGSESGIRDLCSGNRYDWSGRAIRPAKVNLTVPTYDLALQLYDGTNIPAQP